MSSQEIEAITGDTPIEEFEPTPSVPDVTEGRVLCDPPKTVNRAQLVTELEALNIAGVRGYSIFGSGDDTCAGVYAWDASAPAGEYAHKQLSATKLGQIEDAITAHVPA